MDFKSLAKFTDTLNNYFKDEFRVLHDIPYGLRHRNYNFHMHVNKYGMAVPEHRVPHLINSLPIEFQNIANETQLKLILKNYYMNK